jgi:enoyl-CoA hydratase/carnithine racemase
MKELTAELLRQSERKDVQVVILKGAGRAFSAGHDMKELQGRSLDEEREIFAICEQLMQTIRELPQTVIASVHGIATAAGCQLVATCDLAVASEEARFATNGIRNGIFCYTPQVPVSRSIARKRAYYMVITGDFVDARTAAEWGLINSVVPAERLDAEVMELAGKIGSLSPIALRTGKKAFYAQLDQDMSGALHAMSEEISCNLTTDDAQEGINAFLEKRPPVWKGS